LIAAISRLGLLAWMPLSCATSINTWSACTLRLVLNCVPNCTARGSDPKVPAGSMVVWRFKLSSRLPAPLI